MSKTSKKQSNRKGPLASAKEYDIGTRKRGVDGRLWTIVSYNGVKRWTVPKSNKSINKSSNARPSKRKSPIESATEFPVGTKRWGLDGKQWIITESVTGVKRWIPYNLDTSVIRYRNDTITFFDADKIISKLKLGRMKKLGSLNITSNRIGAGELLFYEFPTAKGTYNIYHYAGSLIAVHENESLKNQKFCITKYSANCDIGMFSYNDVGYVRKYIKQSSSKKITVADQFPQFDTSIFIASNNRVLDFAYVYDTDLDINKNSSVTDSEPIAIFANSIRCNI